MTLLLDEQVEGDAAAPALIARDAWLLPAALSLGAAIVHFGFAPVHFEEKTSHGLFFLLLGAYQAAWAVAALWRPSRWVRWAAMLQVVPVVVWALSRTVGVDGYDAEPVGFPDALSTGLELAVLFTVLGRVSLRRSFVVGMSVVTGTASVYALAPRFAEAHEHGAAGHTGAAAAVGHGAAGLSPCERSGPPASPAQITDGHSHRGPLPQQPVSQATRAALAAQQEQARAVAAKYPTVADATKAGYRMSTPFVPCIGAHFTNIGLVARFDVSAPSELLYDGTLPDSKLVGLSYLVYHPGGAPEGFAGPNDVWHQHNANGGLCFNMSGVVIAGEESTQDQCRALGGFKRELTDVWMLHDWVVPGWECTWGVFAPECPELGGTTGLSAWD